MQKNFSYLELIVATERQEHTGSQTRKVGRKAIVQLLGEDFLQPARICSEEILLRLM